MCADGLKPEQVKENIFRGFITTHIKTFKNYEFELNHVVPFSIILSYFILLKEEYLKEDLYIFSLLVRIFKDIIIINGKK